MINYASIYLTISIYPSIYLISRWATYPSIYLSTRFYLFTHSFLSIYPSFCPPVSLHLPVHPSIIFLLLFVCINTYLHSYLRNSCCKFHMNVFLAIMWWHRETNTWILIIFIQRKSESLFDYWLWAFVLSNQHIGEKFSQHLILTKSFFILIINTSIGRKKRGWVTSIWSSCYQKFIINTHS